MIYKTLEKLPEMNQRVYLKDDPSGFIFTGEEFTGPKISIPLEAIDEWSDEPFKNEKWIDNLPAPPPMPKQKGQKVIISGGIARAVDVHPPLVEVTPSGGRIYRPVP
jgi:hypothetical protein